MKQMLIYRYNRLKYLIKQCVRNEIKYSEYVREGEIIKNEIYMLEAMK
jgi:hypothetical protein